MKNSFLDVHNLLMEQMERLNDEDLTDDELEKEIKRADAMTEVATSISENAKVILKAEEFKVNYCGVNATHKDAVVALLGEKKDA